MNGVLLVNKEKNYTSRDVVNVISNHFKEKKVGHFGTLDPIATGILIIGLGTYTKVGNLLETDTKEYIATVLVGKSTDTYDITGNILEESDYVLNDDDLKNALYSFKKTYLQEVPLYSAVKVNGKKLYQYARNGENIDLPSKEVTIHDIELLSFDNKFFTFKCTVSKGTYIRSLVNDISKYLNVPMCMSDLERIKQDKFSIENSFTLEEIKEGKYELLNIRDLISLKEVNINSDIEKKVLNGSKIDKICDGYVLFTKDNEDIVLYKSQENIMKPVLWLKK